MLNDLVQQYVQCRNELDEIMARKSALEHQRDLLTEQIVQVMLQSGMSAVTMNGNKVTLLPPRIYASVAKEHMDAFRTWALAEALSKTVLQVNSAALAKEVRVRREEGLPVPEYINIYQKQSLRLDGRKSYGDE
jgi:hypothetical protein